MEYNKNTCVNNIYKLVKEKNLRIGEIESISGVSVGYFSKLLKEGNTASPSIEVLSKISDILNVSLDTLCKNDLSSLSDTDLYINNFLSSLIKKTNEGEFIWIKESKLALNSELVDELESKSKKFFEFEDVPYKGETEYPEYHERPVFKSLFRKGELLEAFDDCFYLELPTSSTVFLMNISRINNGINRNIESDVDIEIYIQYGNEICPITRLQSKEESTFDNIIRDLYTSAKESSKHNFLNRTARNAIDSYMDSSYKIFYK